MEKLHGILIAYEMRIESDNSVRKDVAFKASKKQVDPNSNDGSNLEEENFIRKLHRGSRKYKGKLPFNFFNYGDVGNFMDKCPYKDSNNVQQKHGKKLFLKGNKVQRKHKIFFINEEGFSIDDEDQDISKDEREKDVFMAMENIEDDAEVNSIYNDDEVDLMEKLLYVGKEIKGLRKIIVEEVKAEDYLSQNLERVENMIIDMKIEVEEARRIEEVLTKRLLSRDKDYEKLEAKIVSLRKDLDKINHQLKMKFGKRNEILDDIGQV